MQEMLLSKSAILLLYMDSLLLVVSKPALPYFQQDFLVGEQDGKFFAVERGNSTVQLFEAPSADVTINSCIGSLGKHGGTIGLLPGVFTLAAPIRVDRSSVMIAGANAGGDLFFTSMGKTAEGFANKWASILNAEYDGDAIQVGFGDALIYGFALHNVGISGTTSEQSLPRDAPLSQGAGLHVRQCDTVDIRRVQVRRKQYGIRFSKDPSQPMPWNVADVLSLDGGYFSYCGWALHVDGWLGNAKIRNIWSYLNAQGLLFKSGTIGQYDWNLADLTSQVRTSMLPNTSSHARQFSELRDCCC